jgi:hypothetical protein
MIDINLPTIRHHTLTVLGLVLTPLVWLALNCYSDKISLLEILRTWNDTRRSGEPWGWFDRSYKP